MDSQAHCEVAGDLAVFRPTGQVSLKQAVQLVTAAIAFARELRVGKLLVDTTALTGFEPPSLSTHYFFVHD